MIVLLYICCVIQEITLTCATDYFDLKKTSNDKNGQANISYVTKQSEGDQV